jgi:hypothetical protein
MQIPAKPGGRTAAGSRREEGCAISVGARSVLSIFAALLIVFPAPAAKF